MKVLIVDDYPVARAVLRKILERLGATEIVEAADGRSALEKLREAAFSFDLLLLDWSLPHISGIDIARELARHPVGRHLPFIMVTGQNDPARVAEAFYAGATNYIVKPFTPETIRRKIAEVTTLRNLAATAAMRIDGGLTGELQAFGFAEVVQYLQIGRRSGELRLEPPGETGSIIFEDGEARDARFRGLEGEAAFYALARLTHGRFELLPLKEAPRRTIETPTVHLLIEAMRRRDEEAEGLSP